MPRPALPPWSRARVARSSGCHTGSTPTRSRPSRRSRPRPGSPRSWPATGSMSSIRRAAAHGDPGHPPRRTRRDESADRDPRRVRRPARLGSRLRPQHHGRVRRWGRARPRRGLGRAARRDRLPRHPGRGAGERQAVHDRRRPVRGHRRGAPLSPVRSQPRREPPAGIGGCRGRLYAACSRTPPRIHGWAGTRSTP